MNGETIAERAKGLQALARLQGRALFLVEQGRKITVELKSLKDAFVQAAQEAGFRSEKVNILGELARWTERDFTRQMAEWDLLESAFHVKG